MSEGKLPLDHIAFTMKSGSFYYSLNLQINISNVFNTLWHDKAIVLTSCIK